jgi:tetratricopeptide (TPR) repeat protein
MGRIDDAISEATKALELAPEKEKGGLEAFIAQLKGELSRAELVQTYLSQGQSYLAERDWDKAEEVYLKVLELDPNSLQAHSALGYVYAQTGRLEEAVEENLAVIALDPNDYISRKNLAILYRQLGRIDEAIAQALIARDLAPENERKAVDAFIAELKEEKGD